MRGTVKKKKSLLQLLFPDYFDKGKQWERYVLKRCKRLGSKLQLHGLYLPTKHGKWTEVDVVFITAQGIFAVECKNYGGKVKGSVEEKFWVQSFPNGDNFSFHSPILQNWGHISALKSFLKMKNPNLYQSVLLFSDRCSLEVTGTCDQNVWLLQEKSLKDQWKKWKKMPEVLSKAQQKEIYKLLKPCCRASKKVKKEHLAHVEEVAKKAEAEK